MYHSVSFSRGVAAIAGTSLALLLLSATVSVQAQTLTDIVLFRTDSNGNTISEGWNTRGSDGISNLYLISGSNFLNTGNGTGVNVAIDLSVPGSYTFGFAGENVNNNTTPPLAINLFFNNNATTPGISARGVSGGAFFALGGTTSLPGFGTVTGANSLSFDTNSLRISLTQFSYLTTSGTDRVGSFNNAPDGGQDTTGTFTLNVAPVVVPEASPLAFVMLGSVLVAIRSRRKSS